MKLQSRLDEIKRQLGEVVDPAERALLDGAIERLRMLQVVEHGLAVGDVLPDFVLPDSGGRPVASDDLLTSGPLVLTFFRGPWCPYCSMTLEALNGIQPAVRRLGGTMVAVAPLACGELERLARERALDLHLLSDRDAAYAGLCGVRFEMTEEATALYRRLAVRFDLHIPGLDGTAGWELPIPATYVVGRDGVIVFAFGDADWSRRADPDEVVGVVRRLGQAAVITG